MYYSQLVFYPRTADSFESTTLCPKYNAILTEISRSSQIYTLKRILKLPFRPEEDSKSSACACKPNYKPILTPKTTPLSGKGLRPPERPASMKLRQVDYARQEKPRGRETQRRSTSDTQHGRSRSFTLNDCESEYSSMTIEYSIGRSILIKI